MVREPGDMYTDCISSHPLRGTIDVSLARQQHARYCSMLEEFGIEVIRLPRDDAHPDSCFVEDNAVVQGGKALICRCARESRRGEEAGVESVLGRCMPVRRAAAPATIEGGDVIHLEDRLISGLTQRTNSHGVRQLSEWLGVRVDTVENPGIVHLKSYANYVGKGKLLSTRAFARHPAFEGLEVIAVPDEEWYGTNVLAVDDRVLMPEGFPRAKAALDGAGFRTTTLDMSEFPKCEGAFTCLSILF